MQCKRYILIFLLFCIAITNVYAKSFNLDEDKSKITYSLTQFGIPFKRKDLPASGKVYFTDDEALENKLPCSESFPIAGVDLTAKFTSKNPLFRKVINLDKYPSFSFSSKIEAPILLSDKEFVEIPGYLTFHGVTQNINAELKCKKEESKLILRGHLNIKMTDFGIKPPRILFIPIDNVIKNKIEIVVSPEGKLMNNE